jgi:hypothetical protein
LFDECCRVTNHVKEFGAVLDGIEGADGGENLRGDDHYYAEGDDGGELSWSSSVRMWLRAAEERWPYVEPSPEHPGSVLVDLEHLDVVDREPKADCGQYEQSSDPGLSRECSAKGFAGDHDGSDVGDY